MDLIVENGEKKSIFKMFAREREYLMYEVFLDKGLDVFMKKTNFERQARPIVKHFAF